VQWNGFKRGYDLAVAGAALGYVGVFVGVGVLLRGGDHGISPEVLAIRALGTCGFAMLNVILCIGPLARLDRRFLPLLYNRRHLGVATFCVGGLHALLATGYYHGFGVWAAPVSLLAGNTAYRSVSGFPFELLGLGALVILFLMAATSHDFWLKNLGARAWKWLHMGVYLAWGLLVMHVALGALQSERSGVYSGMLWAVVLVVPGLHVLAGFRSRDPGGRVEGGKWVDVCAVSELEVGRGRVARVAGGERIALFRDEAGVHAMSNVCAHQGGPLGEGRIVGGCVTCPWHGFQYQAKDGCAPPPFTEKLPTYRVRVVKGRVEVDPKALPPGTETAPGFELGGEA
jgi:nitrite reductase/ring-hydroxylating ferredoxin subunit/DMSO/TMAO reductase YedYZ heme-binding membrane subunit